MDSVGIGGKVESGSSGWEGVKPWLGKQQEPELG